MTRFLIVFLFQSKYFKILPPIYDRGTNDQYCQHYITSTYSKISDFIEGMDQNAWCSLCSSKESHCSGEEMLPVRVSADNCRGGAVSSARWLLCYTLVYRQHQENTLLHSTTEYCSCAWSSFQKHIFSTLPTKSPVNSVWFISCFLPL